MLHLVEHWASRGFVVVAADYPGVCSYDMIGQTIGVTPPKPDEASDTVLLLDELKSLTHPNLAFLAGHIDLSQLGITGHSQGGVATGSLSKRSAAKVMIPMAGGGTHARDGSTYSTLVLAGARDSIARPILESAGYAASPKPKRRIAIAGSGHETYTDLCWMAPAQGGITGVGRACPVPVAGSSTFEALADQGCRFAKTGGEGIIPPDAAWEVARYATAGVFEETLMCDDRMPAQLAALSSRFNSTLVSVWKEDL